MEHNLRIKVPAFVLHEPLNDVWTNYIITKIMIDLNARTQKQPQRTAESGRRTA